MKQQSNQYSLGIMYGVTLSPGDIVEHSATDGKIQDVLDDFDDKNKIVVVSDVLKGQFDFFHFLELGGDMSIPIQSYKRLLINGCIHVQEEEIEIFHMSCNDYLEYYRLCNLCFENLTMPLEGRNVEFKYKVEHEKTATINIFETVLYAVDIPIQTLPIEFDQQFRHHFRLSDELLPGMKYCYFQFVSLGNTTKFNSIKAHIIHLLSYLGACVKQIQLRTKYFCWTVFRSIHHYASRWIGFL